LQTWIAKLDCRLLVVEASAAERVADRLRELSELMSCDPVFAR
jgi:hypothetical protein